MSLILDGSVGVSDIDGSAATPAYRGTDANTGMFFPAADTIAFSEGGVESLRIDSAGNLGLNVTPSPWGLLKALQIQNASFAGLSNTTYVGSNVYFDGSNFKYISTAASTLYTLNNTAGQHQWSTAASGTAGANITYTQAMTLNASGNLGIGTSSPSFRLEVQSTGGTTSQFERTDGTYVLQLKGSGTTSTGALGMATNDMVMLTNGSERMRITSTGDVGIGTTIPTGRLELLTPSGTKSNLYLTQAWGIDDNTDYGSVFFGHNQADFKAYRSSIAGFKETDARNSGLRFLTSNTGTTGTERMRITSDGFLCVGTTSAIQVGRYSCAFAGNTTNAIVLQTTFGSAGSAFIRFVNSAGTAQGEINATSTTAVAYVTSSDYRLKENIAPMTGALAKVAQLKPVTYNWKVDGSNGQGFIAHELQAVVPEAVTGQKDAVNADGSIKPQGIDTSFLVATLTAAIQELKAEFDAYKATHP